MSVLPNYKVVLTGGQNPLIPIRESEKPYFAAVSEDDPPTTAYILFTGLQFPARLKAQLRENLKRRNVQVIDQIEITPSELEKVYATAEVQLQSSIVDLDYERALDSIRALLNRAVAEDASDIHIVRRRRTAAISFRIDGQVIAITEWSEQFADQSCRFLYEVMGNDQEVTWNRHEPQDAVVDTVLSNGRRIRIRIGTIPASPDGYDMVLRILPGSGETMSLEDLGYVNSQLDAIHALAGRPSGLVIMAGGVGSGKSTSIVGMLHKELEMHQYRLRIITVEDPPERVIPGATQVPVVRKRGSVTEDDFSFAIRAALRCDPDTLMVGEIRDLQSATLTIKFAQSGHRVYTTVHASTATAIVSRLIGIGVDPSLLCTPDVLKGLIYQTLVPVLCSHCKISSTQWLACDDNEVTRRAVDLKRVTSALEVRGHSTREIAYRSSNGCTHCAGNGVVGRTLIAEVAQPDDEMLGLFRHGDYIGARKHWIRSLGGQPVEEHSLHLVASGKVSPLDIEWRIGHLGTNRNLDKPDHSSHEHSDAKKIFRLDKPLTTDKSLNACFA